MQHKLKQINIYPLKSGAGIELASSQVDPLGLAFDRRFVLTDQHGQFITARTHNKLCLISSVLTDTGLHLNAPGMPELNIEYHKFAQHYKSVQIWSDKVDAQYCSIHYDMWFSGFLGQSCQLLYFGELSVRQVYNSDDKVTFADGYPLLLISQASLDDLNSRSQTPVGMSRFRPNLVVGQTEAFAEDGWKRIKIGEVEFEVAKPCARCVFTTIDPLTAEKHPLLEPLATLQKYRQDVDGEVMFGQNLIALNRGTIRVNDPVFVLKKQAKAVYVNNAPVLNNAKSLTLHCTHIIDETHDVKTFVLQTTDKQSLSYVAGQHLPIELMIDGEKVRRCYTLSSSPTRKENVTITVKRVEGGVVSNYLHDNFQLGSQLQAQNPNGQFSLQNKNLAKVLLLSAGSGITPMLSMLKAMTDQKMANDIVFFHSGQNKQDLIAQQEVATLAKQHGQCQIMYTLTRATESYEGCYLGHINQAMLADITDLTQREVFFCGPSALRESTKSWLMALGLPAAQFHFESFGGQARAHTLGPAKEINILFESWHTTYQGNNQQTLLEQAEAAGLLLPYSCRAGMCGTCKIKVQKGEVVQLTDMGGLSVEQQQQGYALACNCVALTDVVLSSC